MQVIVTVRLVILEIKDYLKKADHAQILGKQAAAEAILLLDAVQAPSGLLPVILGPAQSGILLHEAVGHPLEADFNRKGTSAYSDRIGEMVASDLCSIYDSGTIENERGAIDLQHKTRQVLSVWDGERV